MRRQHMVCVRQEYATDILFCKHDCYLHDDDRTRSRERKRLYLQFVSPCEPEAERQAWAALTQGADQCLMSYSDRAGACGGHQQKCIVNVQIHPRSVSFSIPGSPHVVMFAPPCRAASASADRTPWSGHSSGVSSTSWRFPTLCDSETAWPSDPRGPLLS